MDSNQGLKNETAADSSIRPATFLTLPQVSLTKSLHSTPAIADQNRTSRFDQQMPFMYNPPHAPKSAFMSGVPGFKLQLNYPNTGSSFNGIGMPSHQKSYVPPSYTNHVGEVLASGEGSEAENKPSHVQPAPKTTNQTEKQRRRVSKACDRCRLHKIKCTGNNPCRNCIKHGIQCVYNLRYNTIPSKSLPPAEQRCDSDTFTASGIKRPDSQLSMEKKTLPQKENDLVGLSKDSYIRGLENRVLFLERLLSEQRNVRDDSQYRDGMAPKVSYFSASAAEDSPNEEGALNGIGTDLDCKLKVISVMRKFLDKWRANGKRSVGLTVLLCRYLFDNLSEASQAKVQCPRAQYYGWNLSGCHYLRPEPIPQFPTMLGYTDKDKTYLVEFFFTEINPLFAILHESVFREQLRMFSLLQADVLQQGNRTALFLAMLLLVFALSIRFSEFLKPKGPNMHNLHVEECLFKYALRVIQIFLLEWESFELIQCWLLTTLYLRLTHKQSSCGNALNQALNMARLMGLGLHVFRNGPNPYEVLKAKRIFFSVFCFDRIFGLLGGNFTFLSASDIHAKFPLFDFNYESEDDDWVTLPSLAMIHISRLTYYIELYTPGSNQEKISTMESDLHQLEEWLDENGFSAEAISKISKQGHDTVSTVSLATRVQVHLYFCDLVSSIYSKLMNQFITGNSLDAVAVDFTFPLKIMQSSLQAIRSLDDAGLLFSPWYLTVFTPITAGISASVFIASGKFERELREVLREALSLLHRLQDSPVYDDTGRLVFRERFKMVKECIWVLKMVNHMISLRHEEAIQSCRDIGIDHGPADVNKQTFAQFHARGEKSKGLDELLEKEDFRKSGQKGKTAPLVIELDSAPNAVETAAIDAQMLENTSQPDSTDFGMNELFGHLLWFDQWMFEQA